MHESPSAPTTLQRDLMKLGFWKTLLFEVVFFFMISLWHDLSLWLPLWKSYCLITLEIWSLVLNLILLSSKSRLTKPWFHITITINLTIIKLFVNEVQVNFFTMNLTIVKLFVNAIQPLLSLSEDSECELNHS